MKRVVLTFLILSFAFSYLSSEVFAGAKAVPFDENQTINLKPQPRLPSVTGKLPSAQAKSSTFFPKSLKDGAQRLADLQSATDGGWDWDVDSNQIVHSGSASPTNTYGVTAMGVLGAYIRNKLAFEQTVIQNAFTGIEANTLIRTGGVPQFLIRAKRVFGVTAYADTGKSRYDVRKALSPPNGTAGDRARQIRDVRCTGQGLCNGVIPWDIGLVAVDAYEVFQEYGGTYDDDVDSMAEVIYDVMFTSGGVYFDWTDKDEWWWTLGISGALEAFVVSGTHATDRDMLLDTLLNHQLADGSFEWNGVTYAGAGDWQTTAYAIKSLISYRDIVGGPNYGKADTAARKAAHWLALEQRDNHGGWYYSGYSLAENTEVDGECLWALYLAGYIPPKTPSLTYFGYIALPVLVVLVGIVLYRRRNRTAVA